MGGSCAGPADIRWWRKPGSRRASSRAPAMQARPPETTETVSPKPAATAPASRSPIRGPPVTTAICRPASRPRSASGTASWRIVLRNTAEAGDGGAPGDDRDDDREALALDPADPAGGERAGQGARAGRGVEEAEGRGAPAEKRGGQRGEQSPRHAEHHGVDVDQVGALDGRP